MQRLRYLAIGFGLAIGLQSLTRRLLLAKFRQNVAALNQGDWQPLLDGFADDAVLHFNDGSHRWAGEHRGRTQIETFLRGFVGAGLQGEIKDFWIAGPPWALTGIARFDDRAVDPEGEELYSNQTVILVKTRWGKVVEQRDYYVDTERITEFDRKLTELGIEPAS